MTVIGKPKVELIGNDGNAFAVLGRCTKAARQAGWTQEAQDLFLAEAMEGDYNHLLGTVCRHFEVGGSEDAEDYIEEDDLDYDDEANW